MINRIEEKIADTNVTSEASIKTYLEYNGFYTQFMCTNELQQSFGLVGKYSTFAEPNKTRLYCPQNNYTCCSDSQIESSMVKFGQGVVNLKKNLEPLIEISVALMTAKFVNYFSRAMVNPVCSNILYLAFGIDTTSKFFNSKTHFKELFR